MRKVLLGGALAILVSIAGPARATTWLIPPVDGPTGRAFEAPSSTWGPGHRGIDIVAAEGTPVTAAAPGIVTFAGEVAGTLAVTIDHGAELETTYTQLGTISVRARQFVDAGTWLGSAGGAHPGVAGLHFGVRLHGTYVDPARFLGPLDPTDAIHLAPLQWRYSDVIPDLFGKVYDTAGTNERSCTPAGSRPPPGSPPNDNVVVAVAGIGSRTAPDVNAAMYRPLGPMLIGYDSDRIYRFSYKGSDTTDLHEPYTRDYTFRDLRGAALELRQLLARIRERHPRSDVDLIAHSQGGVVARAYLQENAREWDQRQPRIDHVVTFSTPHQGAALADARDVVDDSIPGKLILGAASLWSRRGGPPLDPLSPAVSQLAGDSGLMKDLAGSDVPFGTRALALTIPNDFIVSSDRARWPGQKTMVVPPEGLNGHNAVTGSPRAWSIAHTFLRDGPDTCPSGWDRWGPGIGRAVDWAEEALARVLP